MARGKYVKFSHELPSPTIQDMLAFTAAMNDALAREAQAKGVAIPGLTSG